MTRLGTLDQRLSAVVYDDTGHPGDLLHESSLVEDLQLDSLDIVELAMAIEDEFDISLRDEDVDACTTYGELQELVEREVGES